MSESKTPRTDEIAQRHLAGCDIVTCYHYAIRLANDLETELAASRAREGRLVSALGMILPEWHSDDDGTRANGEVCGEISWGDVRVVRKALEAWRVAK